MKGGPTLSSGSLNLGSCCASSMARCSLATVAAGTLRGADTPMKKVTSKPEYASLTVRTPGQRRLRFASAIATGTRRPLAAWGEPVM